MSHPETASGEFTAAAMQFAGEYGEPSAFVTAGVVSRRNDLPPAVGVYRGKANAVTR